jgi:hypothetical protein
MGAVDWLTGRRRREAKRAEAELVALALQWPSERALHIFPVVCLDGARDCLVLREQEGVLYIHARFVNLSPFDIEVLRLRGSWDGPSGTHGESEERANEKSLSALTLKAQSIVNHPVEIRCNKDMGAEWNTVTALTVSFVATVRGIWQVYEVDVSCSIKTVVEVRRTS